MRWRDFTVLQAALLVSLLVHAALLAVRFVDPQALERAFSNKPLEVILVNARATAPPELAQALAQANLAGGGEAPSGRATSPLPSSATLEPGDAPDDARKRIDSLQNEQQQLLAQIRREIAALPPPGPQHDAGSATAREQEEQRRQLLQLLAEIEKRVNENSQGPKKRYVGPATREAVYAIYYDALRRRVEARGTRDFPQQGGQKLYGELTMNVTVDASGHVVEAEIVRPSGSRTLDAKAVAIVQAAAPYGPFSAAMRAQADQIVVTSRFRFSREDGLETTLSER